MPCLVAKDVMSFFLKAAVFERMPSNNENTPTTCISILDSGRHLSKRSYIAGVTYPNVRRRTLI